VDELLDHCSEVNGLLMQRRAQVLRGYEKKYIRALEEERERMVFGAVSMLNASQNQLPYFVSESEARSTFCG